MAVPFDVIPCVGLGQSLTSVGVGMTERFVIVIVT